MKKQSPVGLVVEGNFTKSVILRLPRIAEDVGPIKSTSSRVAKRLSNFLRAGYAVNVYEQLANTSLVLLRAPDSLLARIIEEICCAELDFSSLCFVLCESWLRSDAFDKLRDKGASIATIMPVASIRRSWFITEGDTRALRSLRMLIERNEGRTLELRPDGKEFYFAAELLATALPVPLLAAAQHALREAGLSGKHLQQLLEEMAGKMFLDFLHAPRIRWGGPLSECAPEVSELNLQLLAEKNPALSELMNEALSFARKHLPPNVRQA